MYITYYVSTVKFLWIFSCSYSYCTRICYKHGCPDLHLEDPIPCADLNVEIHARYVHGKKLGLMEINVNEFSNNV